MYLSLNYNKFWFLKKKNEKWSWINKKNGYDFLGKQACLIYCFKHLFNLLN